MKHLIFLAALMLGAASTAQASGIYGPFFNGANTVITGGVITPSVLTPVYFAHRGSSARFPENTLEAFDATLASTPTAWLEMDVQTLSDGGLGIMHDSTVDRTTTGTGNVNSFSSATFQALNIDADSVNGTLAFGNTLHPPLLPTVLSRYAGHGRFIIEDKDGLSVAAILTALGTANIVKSDVIIQSFTLASATTAAAAGWQSMYLASPATAPSVLTGAGIQWIGVDYSTATANQVAGFVASGIKVAMYTVNRRSIRDTWLTNGATAFFTDDPLYLQSSGPLTTRDGFQNQYWDAGMVAYDNTVTAIGRGGYYSTQQWGSDNSAAAVFHGTGLFGLSPIGGVTSPQAYTIDFSVTFVGIYNGDTSRWVAVWIGNNDTGYADSNAADGLNGYHFLMRDSGTVQIYKRQSGFAANSIGSTAGTAISNNTEVNYRITVTPTTVKLARLDATGADLTAVTVSDSTYRGGYIQFDSNGINYKLRNFAVNAVPGTGSGSPVYATSPTLITPALGVATATSINGNTFTTGTYTLTGGASKTLTFNNSLTLAGTDSTTMTFPSTSATVARTDAAQTFAGDQTFSGVHLGADGAVGAPEYSFTNSPTTGLYRVNTDIIGFATAGTLRGRFDAAGALVLGSSSAQNIGGLLPRFESLSSSNVAGSAIGRWTADSSAPYFYGVKSRSAGIAHSAITTGDELFRISAFGDDGTTYNSEGASIRFFSEGTIATGQIPGRLELWTANSAGTETKRSFVDSVGRLSHGGNLAMTAIETDTTSTTVTSTNPVVICNKATAMTETIPTSGYVVGDFLWVKNIGAGACTVDSNTGNKIDNAQTYVMSAQWQSVTMLCQTASSGQCTQWLIQ